MASPKISIITVSYNAERLIERTFKSVEAQDYPYIEHILVDGASQDGTLRQVHRYMERNSTARHRREITCVSEGDRGIYDAMNKGIMLATGRYLVFLNAGDCLHAPDTISCVVRTICFSEPMPAIVYGDTHIVDAEGRFLMPRRLSPPEVLTWRSFQQGMLVCHQSFYVRTDLARELHYDLHYRFSADFDWCIRLMQSAEQRALPIVSTETVLTDYLNEGATTQNHRKSLWERFRIMAHHYGLWRTVVHHFGFIIHKKRGRK